jgi:carbonic anhydrase
LIEINATPSPDGQAFLPWTRRHCREAVVHRRQALKVFAGSVLCLLCASAGFAAEESHPHWSYDGATGPDKWGGLDAADTACASGDQESAIDITGPISARQPPLEISWTKRSDTIVNNWHTIQPNFVEGDTLRLGDRSYRLTQFHFHHPSEHLVDGKASAMEAHLVHAAEGGALAVVGVFMISGKSNRVFNQIVSTMPAQEGPSATADPAIDPNRLLPAQRTRYHYEGSLTRPPCSQTVDWLVLTHAMEVAEDHLARFAKLYPMNARPIRKLDRRFILSSGPR